MKIHKVMVFWWSASDGPWVVGPWRWSLVVGPWRWSLALVRWSLVPGAGPLVLVVVHFLQFSNLDYTITTALIAV